MKENVFLSIYLMFIMSIILVIQIFTPKFTKKELVFGIRIPLEECDCDEIKVIRKEFIRNNLVIGIPSIILIYLLNSKISLMGFSIVSVFIFIIETFSIYLFSNKRIKKLKEEKGWLKGKKQIVAVDTSFSKDRSKKMLVSPWWFIIPIVIVIINLVIGYKYYSDLQNKVATHWDFAGNVNGYQNKSESLIWQIPGVQLFMTVIMFISYKSIGWAKQQISVSSPEETKKKNRIFRKVWSGYMVAMATAVNILMTLGTLEIFKVIEHKGNNAIIMVVVFLVFTFGSTIFLSIKVGQGGSNLKFKMNEKEGASGFERDDDKYWKVGNSIYYNPDDPALLIEKRFGVGWTVNAGRTLGMIIYIGLAILTVGVILMSIFLK